MSNGVSTIITLFVGGGGDDSAIVVVVALGEYSFLVTICYGAMTTIKSNLNMRNLS